ncbi:MAG: prepilin-type N-terminal cleavage/methylation domain-containing protein [Acidobacteriota bacterium]|nr:MAG: prepilin-type N-terminal cleavage/methylation domain-containing protein [Acidobacteriota bacterium]
MPRANQRGFTIVELTVSLVLVLLLVLGMAGVLIQSAQMNRARQMAVEIQSTARNCMSQVTQTLRTAGWDPLEVGFSPVVLDADPSDSVSYIEVFADLDSDGSTDGSGEQVLIRHVQDRIEWRRSSDTSLPFETLGVYVSNDSDGDGTIEPMFSPDSVTDPSRVVVTITVESPAPDPRSGEFLRYTLSNEVVLRRVL